MKITFISIFTDKLYPSLVRNFFCFCLVTKLCLILCNPMDCSSSGFLFFTISRSLLKLMSTELVMLSNHHILCYPLLLLPSIVPSIRVFQMCQLFVSGGQRIEASASASVLPMNIQGWRTLGLTGLISLLSNRLLRVLQHHNSKVSIHKVLSLLYGPTFTSIHDSWKNHSFNYVDLCQQSDISAF